MMKWPIYYKDFLTLSNRKSNIGICTLWTPKDSVVAKLEKQSFNIGGQLYSKRGINFMIRNILANPIIDTIILCGADKSKSGDTLIKFMKDGVDKNSKVVGDKKCGLQKEVSREALSEFRDNVKIIDLRGRIDLKRINKEIKTRMKSRSPKRWAKPRRFKESKFTASDKFPSEKSTFSVRAEYIWEAWVQVLRIIMKFGSKKGMIKIGEVKELVNIITVLEKEDPYDPVMHKIFNFTQKDLDIYFRDFFDKNKGDESYNYGERLYAYPAGLPLGDFNSSQNMFGTIGAKPVKGLDQLEEIYEKYKRYHEDRGLLAAIWNPWVDNLREGWMADGRKSRKSKSKPGNVPCMALLQFTYRSKKLHLTSYFRSNDMFDAWPRNAFALRKLQFDFARRIGKKPGFFTSISNCAQIYEANYKKADRIIKEFKGITFCKPDPRSTIIIEVKKNQIVAKHMDPDGNKQLDEYKMNGNRKKAALSMMDILQANDVFSNAYQVADIAIELAKAEWCVKNKKQYIQDRDWEEIST